jgi:hypothetical protein
MLSFKANKALERNNRYAVHHPEQIIFIIQNTYLNLENNLCLDS